MTVGKKQRRGRKEETRRATTQHRLTVKEPVRSSSLKERGILRAGALLFTHGEGLFLRFPRVQEEGVTHAKLRENGGIRDRRGRAVVRSAGHGAG